MLQKKSFRFLLFLQIFFVQYCYAQQSETDSLFKRFKNDVQDEHYSNKGRVVWDDETDESFYFLMSNSPIESLIKYTDDSIPAIRAQIFVGLAQKGADESILKEILDNHLEDTAEFIEGVTDLVQRWTVNGYMQFVYDLKWKGKLQMVDFNDRLVKIKENKKNEFHILIPGARHNTITNENLLKIDSLVFSKEGFRILSFTIHIGKKTLTANNVITGRIKRLIRKLKPKDVIYIDEIKGIGPDKMERRLNPIILKIK
ncbi:MAG: hypothetical protein IT256_05005 [Chitinophagaceae bacterium]|nr:hypothetical protein [Chitinophagaceae bacterium]